MTNKENGLLPDKIYVRAVTNKTLSAVRPDSPIAQAEWTGKLKRTEYIRSDIARAQPQNVEGDERLQEAFKIADARNDEVKELDFGTVFWACGIFADHIRNNPKKEPSGNVNAELLEALKETQVVMANAFNRIHCLPRTTDTQIASQLDSCLAKARKAIARAQSNIDNKTGNE